MQNEKSLIRGALSSLRQLLAAESPFKMMKNAFYFNLKPPLMLKNGLIRKIR